MNRSMFFAIIAIISISLTSCDDDKEFIVTFNSNQEVHGLTYSYGPSENDGKRLLEETWGFDLAQAKPSPFVYKSNSGTRYMLYAQPVYLSNPSLTSFQYKPILLGYALFGTSLAETDAVLAQNLRSFFFSALLVLLCGLLVTAMVLRKPLTPIGSMSSTALRIAEGQYDLRLPDQGGPSEIIVLRDTLNHMLEELDAALQTEKEARDEMARFIADASHELRTPLTSIRGFLEILLRNPNHDFQVLKDAHTVMLAETERLIRLAEALLILNRLAQATRDKSIPAADNQTVDSAHPSILYADVVRELTPLFTPLLEQRTLVWQPAPEEVSCEIPMTKDEIKQVLFNLVNNAIQHTPPTGVIAITLSDSPLTLVISDNGAGIPAEDLPHIFERFYQSDRSRTRSATGERGFGLGLAIVQEIVRLRGGQISAASTVGEGTVFTIRLEENLNAQPPL